MVRVLRPILVYFYIVAFVSITVQARDLEHLYPKCTLSIGSQKIKAYIADDDPRREQGLMFVKKLQADTGMLFVFEDVRPLGFWMKNTLIPLSIGFFDERGRLVDIQEMQVSESLMDLNPPSYQSRAPALFALEMNKKWFERHHLKTSVQLQIVGKCSSPLLNQHFQLIRPSGH